MASFAVGDESGRRAASATGAVASPAEPGNEWYDDPKWERIRADREASLDYLEAHRDELLARYPNEEIALHRDRVVLHAAEADEFGRLLEAYLAETGVHPSSLAVRYMDPDPPELAL